MVEPNMFLHSNGIVFPLWKMPLFFRCFYPSPLFLKNFLAILYGKEIKIEGLNLGRGSGFVLFLKRRKWFHVFCEISIPLGGECLSTQAAYTDVSTIKGIEKQVHQVSITIPFSSRTRDNEYRFNLLKMVLSMRRSGLINSIDLSQLMTSLTSATQPIALATYSDGSMLTIEIQSCHYRIVNDFTLVANCTQDDKTSPEICLYIGKMERKCIDLSSPRSHKEFPKESQFSMFTHKLDVS